MMNKCGTSKIWVMLTMKPSTAPGSVSQLGSQKCSASSAARATSSQQKISLPVMPIVTAGEIARKRRAQEPGAKACQTMIAHKTATDQLDERIAPADARAAGAAAAAQRKPAQDGHVLPPGQSTVAGAAVGTRLYDAFACGPACEADVEKAAEGEAPQRCQCGDKNAKHARGRVYGS